MFLSVELLLYAYESPGWTDLDDVGVGAEVDSVPHDALDAYEVCHVVEDLGITDAFWHKLVQIAHFWPSRWHHRPILY